jgi:hypothetical protein
MISLSIMAKEKRMMKQDLKKMEFPNVKVLVNCWTVWQEMNLPVEGVSFEN